MASYSAAGIFKEISDSYKPISDILNSPTAYNFYINKLNTQFKNSGKTSQDKADYVADCMRLGLSYGANMVATKDPRLKYLPQLIWAGQGAIQALTNKCYDKLTKHDDGNHNNSLKDFGELAKYHYERDYDNVVDPIKKVWDGISLVLNQHGVRF